MALVALQPLLLGCLDSSEPVAELGVVIKPAQASIGKGDTVRLYATVSGPRGSPDPSGPVRWSSSAPTIAQVDGSGLVTGRSLGSALVSASVAGSSVDVTVYVVPRFRIRIASPRTNLFIRDTTRFVATVLRARGDTVIGAQVGWLSASPGIATVESSGLVHAHALGVVKITAIFADASADTTISVTPIMLLPSSLALLEGDTSTLRAIVVDGPGDTVPSPTVTWWSADSAVVRIDSTGFSRALKPGRVAVTATIADGVAAATITVDTAILVGAGDIGDCKSSGDDATARLLDNIGGTVFTAGDNAYPDGSPQAYASCYAPTWGRQLARTRPAVGNHEYMTPSASGYFGYFGTAAGDPSQGYYSYDLGAWHIVVLNSSIAVDPTSAQIKWLQRDLAAHSQPCTAAYWHYPLFSSGVYSVSTVRTFWSVLYAAGVDVVISGHDHIYERFGPQTPDGVADPLSGIREFVVGTGGGEGHHPIVSVAANSEVRNNDTFGVLKLTLHASSYQWNFIPITGHTFVDSGTASCH